MGQAIICTVNIETGEMLEGTGFHPDLLQKHGYSANRYGWICSEANISEGPSRYVISANLSEIPDKEKRKRYKKMIDSFFRKHCASAQSVSAFALEHGFEDEMIYVLNDSARQAFNSLCNSVLTSTKEKLESEEKKKLKRHLRINREFRTALLHLIDVVNLSLPPTKKLSRTTNANTFVQELHRCSADKLLPSKKVEEHIKSWRAICGYYESIIKNKFDALTNEVINSGKIAFAKLSADMFQKFTEDDSLLDIKWINAGTDYHYTHMRIPQLELHIGGERFNLSSAPWRIEDGYGRLVMSSVQKTDGERGISINSGRYHFIVGYDDNKHILEIRERYRY